MHRQEDPEFIEILGQIRNGENLESNIHFLNTKCCGPHKSAFPPVILTGTNNRAISHNKTKLANLSTPAFAYEGIITGTFEPNRELFPAPEYIELKVGARVILVKNDAGKKWVNGSLATVSRLEVDNIWIRLDNGEEDHQIKREKWESIRYRWDADLQQVEKAVVGSYTQFPLQLAWAMTIHKAQGLTLQNVRIDLRGGAFSDGQTYVALSRAKSIDGLSLEHPLSVADVRVNYQLSQATKYISEHASAL